MIIHTTAKNVEHITPPVRYVPADTRTALLLLQDTSTEEYNKIRRLDAHRQIQTAYPMKGLHAPSKFANMYTGTAALRHLREHTIDKEASLPAEMHSPVEMKHVVKDIIYADAPPKTCHMVSLTL